MGRANRGVWVLVPYLWGACSLYWPFPIQYDGKRGTFLATKDPLLFWWRLNIFGLYPALFMFPSFLVGLGQFYGTFDTSVSHLALLAGIVIVGLYSIVLGRALDSNMAERAVSELPGGPPEEG